MLEIEILAGSFSSASDMTDISMLSAAGKSLSHWSAPDKLTKTTRLHDVEEEIIGLGPSKSNTIINFVRRVGALVS